MKKKLKEICTIEKGKQIDTKALNDSNSYRYINGGIKESGFYNDFNTSGETVLISEGGASCGYVNYVNEQFWCGCHCYRLTDINAFPKFLFYSLKASQNGIMELRTGAAMPNIKKESLKNFEISIIEDKEEQIKIAVHLDKIQSAIDNKKQQLSLLDEAVKSEFVEMFGENPVESGKWKVEKLEDISTVQTGGTPSRNHPEYFEGNIPWVTTANLGKNELTYEDAMEYISQDAINNSATKIIPANSLFIGIRVGVGKCSINRVDMCSNQDICGLSGFDTTIINLVFLKKVLDSYSDFFENAKRGTTIKGIKSDTIKKLKIFIPELNIQNQFASFIQQIDKSKFVVKQQIADLQELLDSKMQEYFS